MSEVLSEILLEYQAQFGKREFSNLRSILKRHILPNLLKLDGLQHLQDKKLDYIFEHIPLAGFVVIADPIFQSQILQLPRSKTCNVEKSQWKRFCTWLQAHKEYVPVPAPLAPVSEKALPTYTHIPRGTLKAVKALKKKREQQAKPFRLLERDWTPNLRNQRQSFDYFCQTVTRWRKQAIAPATLVLYHRGIERVLGHRKTVQGVALEALEITDLLDLSVLQAYEQWGRNRGLSSNTIKSDLGVAIPVAQWHFHQSVPNENYSNPESVKTIRGYLKSVVDHGDRPRVSDEAYATREVTTQQCLEILAYLSWRCKDLENQHGITNEVIDAWMDYLIIAFLVTTGGRQREVREMRRQQLVLEENGLIIATLPPEGHKTGRKSGKGREYPLFVGPMQLTLSADLQHYLEHVRPQDLNHDFLFFMRQNRSTQNGQVRRGDPICGPVYLSNQVPRLMACVTAHLYGIEQTKWTAPHDFRRVMATWVCTYGEPKHLAIFAELLGHSMDMLVKIYNKMHPGALARQSLLAYDDIAAREKRMEDFKVSGTTGAASSLSEMSLSVQLAMLQKLVRKLWHALTKRKQNEVFEALSAAEREVLDV
jgi:integrase